MIKYKRFIRSIKNHSIIILWSISFILLLLSFININPRSIDKKVKSIQKRVIERLDILEKYAEEAMNTSSEEWLSFSNFPEDMVLYKYNADTLQSWNNLFPISNDEVDLLPFSYRIHDMNSRNLFNTPLSYLSPQEKYVNLGSSWYIAKAYTKGYVKIITGLLVKTEYISDAIGFESTTNKQLKIPKHYTAVPINESDNHIIKGRSGEALFSITDTNPLFHKHNDFLLLWIAFFVALIGMFEYHRIKRSTKSFISLAVFLVITRILTSVYSDIYFDSELFSPSLYADGVIFNSLGELLINSIYIVLVIVAIYMYRKKIHVYISNSSNKRRIIVRSILLLFALSTLIYIHVTLKSIILNSEITLELYKLDEISIYTIIVYLAYASLFLSILYLLRLATLSNRKSNKFSLFTTKGVVIYSLLITLYCVITISIYGFEVEFNKTRVVSNKLAIERDLSLELRLRSIEPTLMNDPLLKLMIYSPIGVNLISNRISELYFWDISQKYDIRVTSCGELDPLITENHSFAVPCFDFFYKEIIEPFGIPLASNSMFYYIDNNSNKISYIGVISYIKGNDIRNLYIEIDSKPTKDAIGYPSLLIDADESDFKELEGYYSYAKYHNNKLVTYKGRYNYPIIYDQLPKQTGYFTKTINRNIHFINRISQNDFIVVSRPIRTMFPYIIFFSYLFLFYAAFILLMTNYNKSKSQTIFKRTSKNTFRRKITLLVTFSMIFALICMGIGSVIFTINLVNENNRIGMEEKISSVQTTLSEMCKYAQRYNEINTFETFSAMDKVASNTQVDINLFDPHGRLIRSTKPEIFDQYLASSRMNPDAFYQLIFQHKKQVIIQEEITNIRYYSLYAPIFNEHGDLIAIANIPYFLNTNEFREDASSIIAAIINLYLILLIAAALGGTAISNSITKPLEEISKNMQQLDVAQKSNHINYRNNDELGILVKAYNKMIDDLEESTKQLAQSEREQAWKEMARQIAHEIKNPLTPMRLSIQHLVRLKRQNTPGWEDKFETLSTSLLEQIDILSDTATEFSSFAKFYNEDDIVFDLITIVHEQYILFDTRENIKFQFISEIDNANIYAKKSQIARALVNIISNAVQSLEQAENGKIRITLTEIEGSKFQLSIEDNGLGVLIENRDKLFKPNFTTKSGGTGLGLAICKSIIDQSQGSIRYDQSSLGGAAFIIVLPKYYPPEV